jgi:hypothetical protein
VSSNTWACCELKHLGRWIAWFWLE